MSAPWERACIDTGDCDHCADPRFCDCACHRDEAVELPPDWRQQLDTELADMADATRRLRRLAQVSGHASHAERLEIMREAYRKVFGAEMPEPDADGTITMLSFTRRGVQVSVSVQVAPPPGHGDVWQGSDL